MGERVEHFRWWPLGEVKPETDAGGVAGTNPVRSAGEQGYPRPVTLAQLFIAGVKDGVGCYSQRYIGGLVGRKVLGGERPKSRENLLAAIRIDTLAGNQSSKSAGCFHIQRRAL